MRIPVRMRCDLGREIPVWAFLLFALACILPAVWSVSIPPLHDYHNHLARQYILHRLDQSPVLGSFYMSMWRASPYLMFDAVVQALATVMPVAVAGKVFVTLMLVLLASAPAALNLALLGRITPLALLGPLFAFNQTVTLGFVNFMFGVAMALVAFAVWIRLRSASRTLRWVAMPLLCAAVFFSHLLGFVIYMATVSSYEIGRYVSGWRKPDGRLSIRFDREQWVILAAILLQAALPLLLFAAWGPTTESVSHNTYGGLQRKVELLTSIFGYLMPYPQGVERALRWLVPAVLLALLALRKVRLAEGAGWPMAAMLGLFLAMPVELFGGWGADHRLLPALGLLAVGVLRPTWNGRASWAIVILGGVILARAATVTAEWVNAGQIYARYLRALELVPNGSRLFYAFGHSAGQRLTTQPVYHVPQQVLATRDVYVPFLFASTSGWLTLRYRDEVEPLQRLSAGPVLLHGDSPGWESLKGRFDYFLLVDQQHFSAPVPDWLTLRYEEGQIRLYSATPIAR